MDFPQDTHIPVLMEEYWNIRVNQTTTCYNVRWSEDTDFASFLARCGKDSKSSSSLTQAPCWVLSDGKLYLMEVQPIKLSFHLVESLGTL